VILCSGHELGKAVPQLAGDDSSERVAGSVCSWCNFRRCSGRVSGVEGFDDDHGRTAEVAQVNTTGGVLVVGVIVG